jgi:hypothetical protein
MQKSNLGWAGAHFVKGPAREPRPYPVWSDQEWTNLKVRLKSKNSISNAVRQKIFNATSSYVEQATSYETLTRGSILPMIKSWRGRTQALRKAAWSKESDATSWAGAHKDKDLSLNTIQRFYFKWPLRETIKRRVQGRPRQILATLALGLDIAMTCSDYVIEEMKDDNLRIEPWKLWYVWVALIDAILRENQVPAPPGNFDAFIAGLQRTLPEDWMKHQALRKDIRVALKFSDTSNSRTLLKLLRCWGSFDRMRRSTDPALQKLIDSAHLLSRLKKVPSPKARRPPNP